MQFADLHWCICIVAHVFLCCVLSCLVLSCLVWSSRVVSYTVRLSSLSLRLVDIFGHRRERQRREVSWAASSIPRQRRSLNACACSTKGRLFVHRWRWQCLQSRHCRHISRNAHAQGPATPHYYLSWKSLENTTLFFNPLNIRFTLQHIVRRNCRHRRREGEGDGICLAKQRPHWRGVRVKPDLEEAWALVQPDARAEGDAPWRCGNIPAAYDILQMTFL